MKTTSTKSQSMSLGADQGPYVRLYQAVVFQAVQDLAQKQHRAEARGWLLSPESDYAFAKAGIRADSIRRQLTRLVFRSTAALEQRAFMLSMRHFADAAA